MSEIIKVGMADLKVCKAPDGLITLGLGSCVGIALRDPVAKVGGLEHAMLPDSSASRTAMTNPYKYVDSGIDQLIAQMIKMGAVKSRIVAKVAGGASMFNFQSKDGMMQVGANNVAAVHAKLKSLGIRILAEDTGLNYGRTVVFYPETGDYVIRAVGKQEKTI